MVEKEKKPEVKDKVEKKPEIDESDFNKRAEEFGKELTTLLGKYEIAIVPTAILGPNQTGGYQIVPQLQFVSSRQLQKTEGDKEKPKEDSKSELVKG